MNKTHILKKNRNACILAVSAFPPPHYGSAVSSQYCLEILSSMDGYRVSAIRLNSTTRHRDIGKWSVRKILDIARIAKEVRHACRSYDPAVVYFVPAVRSVGFYRDFLVYIIMTSLLNAAVIIHLRGRLLPERGDLFKRPLLGSMLKQSHVIVLSEALKADLPKGMPAKSVFVLPNTVEDLYSQKRLIDRISIENKPEKPFTILYLSHMGRKKGWPILLAACSLLHSRKRDFRCVFAGPFPNQRTRMEFERSVDQYGLSGCVKYMGSVSGKEKEDLFTGADSFVLPTELDTFPRVVIEAMMYGVPPTVSRMGALVDVVDHYSDGFILNENTPKNLFECLDEQYLMDTARINMMRIAARRKYEANYEPTVFRHRFERIVQSVLSKDNGEG